MNRKKTQDTIPSRPGMMHHLLRTLLAVFLLLAVATAGMTWLVLHVSTLPGARDSVITVEVPRGAGIMAIAERLEHRGLVPSRWLVIAEIARRRILGERPVLKAGEYAIEPEASLRDIVDTLASGKAILYRVTIPEGFSVAQVVERLRRHPMLNGEITEVPEEGSLLPDTYVFNRGESRQDLLARMRRAQRELLAELWPKRAPGLPFKDPREAVVLASIVEKETARPQERRRIAAVFINRLKRGMRLQADPTVIYGITRGKPLGRPLRRSDLEADHPWNTYRIRGLPPTPIANPGRDSIAAVLDPLPTDELYFVADGSGGHIFASTLKKHNENVRRWRAMHRHQAASRAEARNTAKPGSPGTEKTVRRAAPKREISPRVATVAPDSQGGAKTPDTPLRSSPVERGDATTASLKSVPADAAAAIETKPASRNTITLPPRPRPRPVRETGDHPAGPSGDGLSARPTRVRTLAATGADSSPAPTVPVPRPRPHRH